MPNIQTQYLDYDGLDYTVQHLKTHIQDVVSDYAPIISPALAGTPTAPTPAINTNTNQIATTSFVQNTIGTMSPIVISDDTIMPETVKEDWLWFQLTS